MSKIYTKTGDKGETSLLSGERVAKCNYNLESYGCVDELNAFIGVCISHAKSKLQTQANFLKEVQGDLFIIGSNLACTEDKRSKYKLPELAPEQITKMEAAIDEMESELPELKNFILPGGSPLAAHLHVARTSCRKLERVLVACKDNSVSVPNLYLAYVNRLSDFLFVLSRYANLKESIEETKWQPTT